MHDEVHVVEQNPAAAFLAFHMSWSRPLLLQFHQHVFGDSPYLDVRVARRDEEEVGGKENNH